MKTLYADTTNGVQYNEYIITALDFDNVVTYTDEKEFYDILASLDDSEIAVCNHISDKMFDKIDGHYGVNC